MAPSSNDPRKPQQSKVGSGFAEEEPTNPGLIIPKKVGQTASTPLPRMPDLGPLDVFMKDPSITEILINDIRNVMIEKDGKMSFSGFSYTTLDELSRVTRSILDFTGKVLTPEHPMVDTSLPDGSRVNLVGPPLTLRGPCITIRKFPTRRLSIDDLVKSDTLDRRMAYFLNVCVMGRLNILIAGGTGTGKTTVLNSLAGMIPKNERIVTIEDSPELLINHANSVQLLTKPPSPTLTAITARDLVVNALRMRPDRIIVGECRRGEALDMLQAMNTGHAGSMTTVHANMPRDALSRIETLCLLGGVELPLLALRKQMTAALDLVIQLKRFRNGRRHIVNISEVTGMEADTVTLQDLYVFDPDPNAGPDSPSAGHFRCTGLVPSFVGRLREQGLEFPANFFG